MYLQTLFCLFGVFFHVFHLMIQQVSEGGELTD